MAEKEKSESTYPSGGQQTPLEPTKRRTGTDIDSTNTTEGAEAEAPGGRNKNVPGDPNQGTTSR